MATTTPSGKTLPRHTKDDALTPRKFQLLLEGASELDEYYGQQARFCILVMGRLGLRRAEVAHLQRHWIDNHRNMLVIPRHEPCTKGRDGGPCGDCKQKALQMEAHNPDMTYEAALGRRWHPKTAAAAREVPFDFAPRVQLEIERFFDRFEEYPCSAQSINRRVAAAAEAAPEIRPDDVYPHCLRGTAATYHAARGLDALPLKSLMGWSQLSTAQHYVASSGENTQRALYAIHAQ